MNSFEELKSILAPFGRAVVSIYNAFEFKIAGINFNLWQIIIWGVIAIFLIDRIKDLVED